MVILIVRAVVALVYEGQIQVKASDRQHVRFVVLLVLVVVARVWLYWKAAGSNTLVLDRGVVEGIR